MSCVFTINKSWHSSAWLFEQLLFASDGDVIVLLEDSVLALQSPISLGSFLAKCASLRIGVYAQAEDCQLRGIQNQYPDIGLITYSDFVELVVKHDKQVAW